MAKEIARRLSQDGVTWETVVVEEDAAGSQAVQSVTVMLDDAQIASLPSTPVEMVPAPGAGNVIVAIAAIFRFHNGGGYGGISGTCFIGFRYDYGGASTAAQITGLYEESAGVSSVLDVSEDTLVTVGINAGIHPGPPAELASTNEQVSFPAVAANKALLLSASNGGPDFISGGAHENAMAVTVIYTISQDL